MKTILIQLVALLFMPLFAQGEQLESFPSDNSGESKITYTISGTVALFPVIDWGERIEAAEELLEENKRLSGKIAIGDFGTLFLLVPGGGGGKGPYKLQGKNGEQVIESITDYVQRMRENGEEIGFFTEFHFDEESESAARYEIKDNFEGVKAIPLYWRYFGLSEAESSGETQQKPLGLFKAFVVPGGGGGNGPYKVIFKSLEELSEQQGLLQEHTEALENDSEFSKAFFMLGVPYSYNPALFYRKIETPEVADENDWKTKLELSESLIRKIERNYIVPNVAVYPNDYNFFEGTSYEGLYNEGQYTIEVFSTPSISGY